MERRIKCLLIISGILTILVSFFLALYYGVFNKEHQGPMDWWAIILIIIPVLVLIISRILVEQFSVDIDESYKGKSFLGKVGILINKIVMGIGTVLLLPIGIIFLVVSLVVNCFNIPGKRSFKKLMAKGFKYKFENRTYILTRDDIVIWVFPNFEDYYISFDKGENFVRVEDSDLGLPYNREILKSKLNAYRHSHPVDKQRGDALPPVSEFVDFLVSVL